MKTIFVSSTFKDMHFERDAIQEKVLPEVNHEALKYGQRVSFCDLRWGVNTKDLDSDEGSRRVLDVCLDEIDRCKPPMVVILGNRYGWIPDGELILTATERKHFQLEDYRISVTALEIEYGALADEEKRGQALFYFREIENEAPEDYAPEDEAHTAKLRALKDKILRLTDGRVKTYQVKWNGTGFDGIDTFVRMLADDIKDLLVPEWKAYDVLPPFERDLRVHTTFVAEKAAMFRARNGLAEKLRNDIRNGKPLTILKGEAGSGKSTLFCRLAELLREDGEYVLPLISGLTWQSGNTMDIVRTIAFYFEEQLGLPHYDEETEPGTGERVKHKPKEWANRLAELSSAFARSGRRVILMLDAADQLFADENRKHLLFIPRTLGENVRFVLSALSGFDTGYAALRMEEINEITLRPLDREERREVIEGMLAANGKQLSEAVIHAMTELDGADSPLFLSLLIQRLTMMNRLDFEIINSRNKDDQMSEIEKRQLAILDACPETLDAMYAALLDEAGRRINPVLAGRTAGYLALSRHGLRQEDLSALLGSDWNALDFARFISYMNDSFLRRDDGRYDFSHKSIRAGITAKCREKQHLHAKLLAHFKSLPENDEIRLLEIIYHTIQSDDKQFFVEYITKYKYDDKRDFIRNAAKITYEHCLMDGGDWLCKLIEHGNELKAGYHFISFINFNLKEQFDKTYTEMHSLLPVLESICLLAEKTTAASTNAYNMQNTAASYVHTADIYQHFGGKDDLNKALALYQKASERWEQLAETFGNSDSFRGLSVSYERIADIYKTLGGRDNLGKALALYQKASEKWEELAETVGNPDSLHGLSISYINIADIYKTLGGSNNLNKALALYQKASKRWEQLAETVGNSDSFHGLSISYINIANIYKTLGGSNNLNKALTLYQKALEIKEQLAETGGNSDSFHGLSVNYEKVAGIYEALGGKDNLDIALTLYQKALKIKEQLTKRVGSSDSFRGLSISYNNVAGIYEVLGGRDNLNKALALYQKALKIKEQLAETVGSSDSFRGLSISYTNVAGIYEAFGGRDNLDMALTLYQKALEIKEQLAETVGDSDSFHGLASSYIKVAGIYETLGDRDNLGKALALYQKTLPIAKQLVETVGNPNSFRGLADIYINMANIYETFGNRDNLDKALELKLNALEIATQLFEKVQDALSQQFCFVCYSEVTKTLELYQESLETNGQATKAGNKPDSMQNLSARYLKIANIYQRLGSNNNLDKTLALYQKTLMIAELLAKESETVDDYEYLITIYCNIAEHPSITKEEKKTYLEQALQLATMLYKETEDEHFKSLLDKITDKLKQL